MDDLADACLHSLNCSDVMPLAPRAAARGRQSNARNRGKPAENGPSGGDNGTRRQIQERQYPPAL